jgi:hypothetical protein
VSHDAETSIKIEYITAIYHVLTLKGLSRYVYFKCSVVIDIWDNLPRT